MIYRWMNMERELKAIKIIHDLKSRIFYHIVAEYFRFIGVFVCEEIPEYPINKTKQDDTQFILDLTEKESSIDINKPRYWINPKEYGLQELTLEKTVLENKKEYLETVFDKVFHEFENMNWIFSRQMANELLQIFLDNYQVIASCNLQFYRMDTDIHIETISIFESVINALKEKQDIFCTQDESNTIRDSLISKRFSYIYQYALLYCKQKINLAYYFLKEGKSDIDTENIKSEYAISDLVNKCKALLKEYPEEANLHVLMGLITDHADDRYDLPIAAYSYALKLIGQQPYASHIYYWLGKAKEREKSDLYGIKEAYAKAYLLQNKYRNIYKVGIMFEQEQNYVQFKDILLSAKAILQNYIDNGICLDPLEIEYYCKICILLCLRLREYFNEIDQTIEIGNEIMKFFHDILENVDQGGSKYFKTFYGTEAAKYQEISLKRVSMQRVYEELAIAYLIKGDTDKSEKYREMY